MKRWKVYVLCAMCVLGIGLLTGCGNREKNGTGTLNSERTEENRATDRVNEGVNDATGDDMTERSNTIDNLDRNSEGVTDNNMPDSNSTDDNGTGIGNAVEDLADGVGNAGENIVDGIEEAGDSLLGDDKSEQTDDQSENRNTTDNQ